VQIMPTELLSIDTDGRDDDGPSFLEIVGVKGSRLRASRLGLTVLSDLGEADAPGPDSRFWEYGLIRDVRLQEHGSLAAVRAQIRTTGNELPLLLLEPDQITAARRVLEIVSKLMGDHSKRRTNA
jgi:hypothetical protein